MATLHIATAAVNISQLFMLPVGFADNGFRTALWALNF
jgi:hypothetical protein